MKLTTDQINYIDYVLKKQYTFENFDDVRIELVDHIATDVEFEMKNKQVLFDDALNSVLFKWKTEISWDRNSRYNEIPNIISRFWKSLDWKYNYSAIPFTLIVTVGIMFLQRKEVEVGFFVYFIAFIGLLSCLFLNVKARKNNFKTTLSIYATDRLRVYTLLLVLFIFVAIAVNIYDGDTTSQPLLWVITHTTVVLSLRSILMYKNIKIENQLLKVI